MKKFLAVLSLFMFIPMIVFTVGSNISEVSFSYHLNYTENPEYDVYFTNNLGEYDLQDRITQYYIGTGSLGRGFYLHIDTNDSISNVTLAFYPFLDSNKNYPEVSLSSGEIIKGIEYDVEVSNVYTAYYANKLSMNENYTDKDKPSYEFGFDLNAGSSQPSSYVYRIMYTDIFDKVPPRTYYSDIVVTVNPDK